MLTLDIKWLNILRFLLLLTFFSSFTVRLSDENIKGPDDPASEVTSDFFPTGFK